MATSGGPSSRLLVVEDDPDISELVQNLLSGEGYTVRIATSPGDALLRVDEEVFGLILTDLFSRTGADPLASVEPLVPRAYPTPVGVLTAWPLTQHEATQRGFAFLAGKPFNLDELLTAVASALELSLSAEQERQVDVIRRYCSAINEKDLDACVALCAEDVVFFPPAHIPCAGQAEVRGRAAYREHLVTGLKLMPDFRFEAYRIYPRPSGLAMRFEESWAIPEGRARMTASLIFELEGEQIKQIGARLNAERLAALLAANRGGGRPPSDGASG
jgi:CheY-like chemotaxis protein